MNSARPDAASGKQRRWHPFAVTREDRTVVDELITAIPATRGRKPPTKSELELRLGEFKALVREAETGQLMDDRWCSIARDPRLWELRLGWEAQLPVRAYFIEPSTRPTQTALLVVHVKDLTPGSKVGIRAAQNAFISVATGRLESGRRGHWGLDWTEPLVP